MKMKLHKNKQPLQRNNEQWRQLRQLFLKMSCKLNPLIYFELTILHAVWPARTHATIVTTAVAQLHARSVCSIILPSSGYNKAKTPAKNVSVCDRRQPATLYNCICFNWTNSAMLVCGRLQNNNIPWSIGSSKSSLAVCVYIDQFASFSHLFFRQSLKQCLR